MSNRHIKKVNSCTVNIISNWLIADLHSIKHTHSLCNRIEFTGYPSQKIESLESKMLEMIRSIYTTSEKTFIKYGEKTWNKYGSIR